MRIILTKHGETEEHLAGILQGHLPGTLTEKGLEQAMHLAHRLKDEPIDYIYSSDLARTADTTQKIVEAKPSVPVTYTERLREINFGSNAGKLKVDVGWSTENPILADDGETWEQLYTRIQKFFHEKKEEHKSDTVLFVAHDDVIKLLMKEITGRSYEDVVGTLEQHDTAVHVLDVNDDGTYVAHTLNCAKHVA